MTLPEDRACFACGRQTTIYRAGYMQGCFHTPSPASVFWVCERHEQALSAMRQRQYELEDQLRHAQMELLRLQTTDFLEEAKRTGLLDS